MVETESEKNYFEKRWIYASIALIIYIFVMPLSLLFVFLVDMKGDFILTLSQITLVFAAIFIPLYYSLLLFVRPIAYTIGEESITIKYCYTLRKRDYAYKDIDRIYFHKLENSLYPDSIIVMKLGDINKQIEGVPNKVISYLFNSYKGDIVQISLDQLKELRKYKTLLSKNEYKPKEITRKQYIKNYKLFYSIVIALGLILAIIGGVLYQVFDYHRVGDIFFIYLFIHFIGISLIVISGLKLITKNRSFLRHGK